MPEPPAVTCGTSALVTCEGCAGVGCDCAQIGTAAPTTRTAANNCCARRRQPVSGSTQPGEQSHLLSVRLGDLADELGPAHIHGRVDLAGLRSRIVFEDFHYQGRVVRNDDASL